MSQSLADPGLVSATPSGPAPRAEKVDAVRVALVGMICLWCAYLYLLNRGEWLTGEVRNHISTDFSAFWAAGRMAVTGAAASVYDMVRHGEVVRSALGPVPRVHDYLNPPPFLFFIAPLGWLDYVAAKIAWIAATFALFLAVAWRIIPHPKMVLAAFAVPVVFLNFVSGQNGLLTAALVGAALVWLPSRPWLAGAFIGCLAVKPQLGLIFPLILAAGGHWRAFAGAALAVLALCLASLLVFGPETWLGFLHSLPRTTDGVLLEGRTGWGKVQSLLGLLRGLGLPSAPAWLLQAAWGIGIAVSAGLVWSRPVPYDLKAAFACVAIVLVQPYTFLYDEAMLAVALAFLARHAIVAHAVPPELGRRVLLLTLCLVAMACLAATMFVVHNLGFVAALLVGTVVAERVAATWPGRAASGSREEHASQQRRELIPPRADRL